MVVAFEQVLASHPELALAESSKMFENEGEVQRTMRKLADRLDALGISYAIAGAMALLYHGYQRFTHDVDMIVSPEGLKRIHEELEGLGYAPLFKGSKNLRDTETGVRIDFITSGGYPGDGKPKPVVFPNPEEASIVISGLRFVNLPKLLELKLASGLTGNLRSKDLGDVEEFVKAVRPPRALAEQIDPFVRAKFLEIWDAVQQHNPDELSG